MSARPVRFIDSKADIDGKTVVDVADMLVFLQQDAAVQRQGVTFEDRALPQLCIERVSAVH